MNGEVALHIALVCHGNAASRGIERSPLFPGSSTCLFCERVEFVERRRSPLGEVTEHVVAATPDAWLESLPRGGALRIHYRGSPDPTGDRMRAGFVGGGGEWCVETCSPDARSAVWMARRKVGNKQAPENRIWQVMYVKIAESSAPVSRARPELALYARRLRAALTDIALFARQHPAAQSFVEGFEGALRVLDTGNGTEGYHKDLAPAGVLPHDAAVLLAACQRASVFGGMGSWNDMGFGGKERTEYDRVSEALFQAMNAAIVAATNASVEGS